MPARCTRAQQRLRLKLLVGALSLSASAIGCAGVPGGNAPSSQPKVHVGSIEHRPWGEVDGKPVTLFTLTNQHGLRAMVATYGGTLTELHVPDRSGTFADIVLG